MVIEIFASILNCVSDISEIILAIFFDRVCYAKVARGNQHKMTAWGGSTMPIIALVEHRDTFSRGHHENALMFVTTLHDHT